MPTARVPCSNAANVGERNIWTQSEFCTCQISVTGQKPPLIIAAALWNRAGHYIFALWFTLLSFFFFPRLISAVADWIYLPYFHTRRGLSANLGCRSETCCTRLAEIQDAKNHHLGTIAQRCRAISSQLRYVSIIGKNC